MTSFETKHSLVELNQDECEQLLRTTPIGRIGFNFAGTPVVLPVTFRYVDGIIVFRTGTGRKLHAVASDQVVSFEVDEWDATTATGSSVVVTGDASEIENYEEFEWAEGLGLEPWVETEDQDRWVQIVPRRMTGRRIE